MHTASPGEMDMQISRAHWPARLIKSASSRFTETLSQKLRTKPDANLWPSQHTHMLVPGHIIHEWRLPQKHTPTFPHIHTYTYTHGLEKWLFSKENFFKLSVTGQLCLHTEWSGKLTQLSRWFSSKHPCNWNIQNAEDIIWECLTFGAWVSR